MNEYENNVPMALFRFVIIFFDRPCRVAFAHQIYDLLDFGVAQVFIFDESAYHAEKRVIEIPFHHGLKRRLRVLFARHHRIVAIAATYLLVANESFLLQYAYERRHGIEVGSWLRMAFNQLAHKHWASIPKLAHQFFFFLGKRFHN